VVLAAALLAACGSDGDDDGLNADEYRDRANRICAEANREVEGLDPPTSPDQLADFLERGLELGRSYDRRFRELDPPDELEDLHERGVRLSERLDERFQSLIDRVRAADEPLAELQRGLQGLLSQVEEADELNRELGLDECLEVPGLSEPGQGPS
jgi:hypothetical protein